jgi:hypothetical protein
LTQNGSFVAAPAAFPYDTCPFGRQRCLSFLKQCHLVVTRYQEAELLQQPHSLGLPLKEKKTNMKNES